MGLAMHGTCVLKKPRKTDHSKRHTSGRPMPGSQPCDGPENGPELSRSLIICFDEEWRICLCNPALTAACA